MDVGSRGVIEVSEVSVDGGSATMSVRQLLQRFEYVRLNDAPLPAARLWPAGPVLLVRFPSLSSVVSNVDGLTASLLLSLARAHEVATHVRWRRSQLLAAMEGHACCSRCRDRLLFEFRERVQVEPVDDVYRLVVAGSSRVWVADGRRFVTSGYLSTSRLSRPSQPGCVRVFVSFERMLSDYVRTEEDLHVFASYHQLEGTSSRVVRASCDSPSDVFRHHSCSASCSSVYSFELVRAVREPDVRLPVESPSLSSGRSIVPPSDADSFPFFADERLRRDIVGEWQARMGPAGQARKPCAVCAHRFKAQELLMVPASSAPLRLLRNDNLPFVARPTTYAFDLYDRAILYPKALSDPWRLGDMDVCGRCNTSLARDGKVPMDALANFQYYARDQLPVDVRDAFQRASVFDLMMVSRARATKISYLFSERRTVAGGDSASQGFVRGNVAVLPQDTFNLTDVIPPGRVDIAQAACALFVGAHTRVSRSALDRLGPVLVNKAVVRTLAHFLVGNNAWYRGEVVVSEDRIADLYEGSAEKAMPAAIELCYLPDGVETSACPASTDETGHVADGIVFDSVGYTDGDHTATNLRLMKAAALARCLDGNRFVQVRSGSRLVNEDHPGLLAWLYPHLDPFGIGGFNELARPADRRLSFPRQVRNLLLQDDSPFQSDPTFAYVCWNIMQKRELNRSLTFRVSASEQYDVGRTLYEIAPALTDLLRKWESNPTAKPSTPLQKKALTTLNRLQSVSRHTKGTSGYKQCRRNEIWGLVRKLGTPSLFVTINPYDVGNPLLGALKDVECADWKAMTFLERSTFVARNPALAAQFFHEVISSFLDVVVRAGKTEPGLFGRCVGHYGLVEAQGRGSLHCHFLLWLKDSPNPQLLKQMMEDDPDYKHRVFEWLESNIRCELPGQTDVLDISNVSRPRRSADEYDPRTELPPQVASLPAEVFDVAYRDFLTRLVETCNWHEHTDTCWKYLRPGDPRDDAHCRMRMNGDTQRLTELDVTTSSIRLRRLHPWINNYNDLVLFLLQCNMDIKFIGSGPAAKALVYYITDYITKNNLSVYVGLDAVKYAIRRNEDLHGGSTLPLDTRAKNKSLFVKTVNALMGRQELSHQQVMSYLVGGGDHYKSHSFVTLNWRRVDAYLRSVELSSQAPDVESDEETPDNVTFTIDRDELVQDDFVTDYVFRPAEEGFANLSLWRFTEQTDKIRISRERLRVNTAEARRQARVQQDGCVSSNRKGRAATDRGYFLGEHAQQETHMMRLRSDPRVVVLLARRLSGHPAEEQASEQWCRTMLVLFKPWRSIADLRGPQMSWSEAFNAHSFDEYERRVITNFNVESECRDARDNMPNVASSFEPGTFESNRDSAADIDSLERALPFVDCQDLETSVEEALVRNCAGTAEDDVVRIVQCSNMFDYPAEDGPSIVTASRSNVCSEQDKLDIKSMSTLMSRLRKHKRRVDDESIDDQHSDQRRRLDVDPVTSVESVHQPIDTASPVSSEDESPDDATKHVLHELVIEFGMSDNEEQQRAFRIVGEHFLNESTEQLLMHIAGTGGVGKTHVINAIRHLFEQMQAKHKLQVTAPTGCAAVLIRGCTIHALTFLPNGRGPINQTELEEIWKDVAYLIIDEISLVSARLLADICRRLCLAKTGTPDAAQKPFGGVNVICTGDFGQLKPVREHALFSHNLVDALAPNIMDTDNGQNALFGAYLWRLFTNVVLLKKNVRARTDPAFANLLLRVRTGDAWNGLSPMTTSQGGTGESYADSDYDVLSRRTLQYMSVHNPDELRMFVNAPVIVSSKVVRDAINVRKAYAEAKASQRSVNVYCARDTYKKKELPTDVQRALWRSDSNKSEDALGLLPLFEGMGVMVTENLALSHSVVNGMQGTLDRVVYSEDEFGNRFADCAFVKIQGSNVRAVCEDPDIVPIVPVATTFKYSDDAGSTFSIRRTQLPLLPAYAFTDYKVQGRSMNAVIVDLASCRSLQSVYVMLSRATKLTAVAVLRWFPAGKIYQRVGQEFREEFARLQRLDLETKTRFENGIVP